MDQQNHDLRIYSVLNLWEPPRLLMSKEDKMQFHCHFGLPLPPQIVVFTLGSWDNYDTNIRIYIDVYLDDSLPPQRVGYVCKDKTAVCWNSHWDEEFVLKSMELYEQDRMAKLSLKVEIVEPTKDSKPQIKETQKIMCKSTPRITHKDTPKSSRGTPRTITSMTRKTPSSETLAWLMDESKPITNDTNVRSSRKTKQRSLEECSAAKRRSIIQTDKSGTPCSPVTSNMSSPKLPTPPGTPSQDSKIDEHVPSGRWGHAVCRIDKNRIALIGGQGRKFQMSKDSLWTLDIESLQWMERDRKESQDADRRLGHTITYESEKNIIYVYGGSKNKRWFSDVHILDLKSWTWTSVKAVGKAPARSYHSSTLFHGELFVLGGVFPNPDPQPDGCSNDLYIFKPDTQSWYQPIVTGEKPKPRSGHSATLLGEQLVIFGGWDAPVCNNDLIILDLAMMEYTSPLVSGKAPSARTWHASTPLPNNKVLIHGGFDGTKIVSDCFIFCLNSLSWTSIQSPSIISPRAGHVAFYCPDINEDKENKNTGTVMLFGGGNNQEDYYNDLVPLVTS